MNAAVYIFSPKIFDYIEENKKQDFGKDILPKLINNNEVLMSYSTSEYIKDMGTSDRLEKIEYDYKSGKIANEK